MPEAERAELPQELLAQAKAEHEEEIKELHIESDPIYLKIVEIGQNHPELLGSVVSKWLKER